MAGVEEAASEESVRLLWGSGKGARVQGLGSGDMRYGDMHGDMRLKFKFKHCEKI